MNAALSSTFAALADPTRLAIVEHLAGGEVNALDLVDLFALSQPAISRHLKVLADAGLILRRIDGTRRPCRLNPAALAPVRHWTSTLEHRLESRFQRLDTLLATDPE